MWPFDKSKHPNLKINVSLPKGWSQLTVPQLEGVSKILIESAKEYTRTGIHDQAKLYAKIFFLLTGLRCISWHVNDKDDDRDIEDIPLEEVVSLEHRKSEWVECEFADEAERKAKQTVDGKIVPIRIYLYEIAYLTSLIPTEFDKKGKPKEPTGGLTWLNKKSDIVRFPYPTLKLIDPSSPRRKRKEVEFEGPSVYMQNFSWKQYRTSCDYMSLLAKQENRLVMMQAKSVMYGATAIAKQQEQVQKIRANFLATIFNARVNHIDTETHQPSDDFFYVSSQSHDNQRFFLSIPEWQFQVVSLWWQGIMGYLSKQYPKVFKEEKIGVAQPDDPFKLYSQSIATMMKYNGITEEEANATTYTVILQHLNTMAEENERIEALKK